MKSSAKDLPQLIKFLVTGLFFLSGASRAMAVTSADKTLEDASPHACHTFQHHAWEANGNHDDCRDHAVANPEGDAIESVHARSSSAAASVVHIAEDDPPDHAGDEHIAVLKADPRHSRLHHYFTKWVGSEVLHLCGFSGCIC